MHSAYGTDSHGFFVSCYEAADIDEPAVGFKHCMILCKTSAVHMVAEGVGITSVVVEGLLTEIYAFGFQHTCISEPHPLQLYGSHAG